MLVVLVHRIVACFRGLSSIARFCNLSPFRVAERGVPDGTTEERIGKDMDYDMIYGDDMKREDGMGRWTARTGKRKSGIMT